MGDDDAVERERRKGEAWGTLLAEHSAMAKTLAKIEADVAVIRKESDALYAIKMVEKIVFGLVTLVCIAVMTALVKLVVAP